MKKKNVQNKENCNNVKKYFELKLIVINKKTF